jgi:putative FmdB family regulatory protein
VRMPLYDYRCDQCGETFEVMQKFSDEPLKTHDGCGGNVERLISAPALQFKGTGWYVTDYAKSGKSSSSTKGSEGGSESKASHTQTESKPESKPAPAASTSDK